MSLFLPPRQHLRLNIGSIEATEDQVAVDGIDGTYYVYIRKSDSADVHLIACVCESKADAEFYLNNFFSENSAIMEEGDIYGLMIGEKLWWLAPFGGSPGRITNIIFIRKNVLVIMSAGHYESLEELAVKLDNQFMKKIYRS